MWLQYLVTTRQWAQFRQFYRQTKATFNENGLFSYRYDPRTKKRYAVNATLDDLRIIRALLTYDQAHHTNHYRQKATQRYQNQQSRMGTWSIITMFMRVRQLRRAV